MERGVPCAVPLGVDPGQGYTTRRREKYRPLRTVLLKSIRQSRVTRVLDVTNFAILDTSPRFLTNIYPR
jgi:hypothetical protein